MSDKILLSRRGFIIGSTAAGATAAIGAATDDDKFVDGGLADVTEPGVDRRNASLKPAGSHTLKNFQEKCVGCQLCVKACPNKVLRPGATVGTAVQPEMAFDKGFCTLDCTRCGEVCPTGAIERVAKGTKKDIHIGEAVWHRDRCLAATKGVQCKACSRHCPTGAIRRVDVDGKRIPVVDADRCIGCGACEHVCPARPMPALTVKAYERHREILKTPELPAGGVASDAYTETFASPLARLV